jgi:hypothetical protein
MVRSQHEILNVKLWNQTSVQVTRFLRPTAHATVHAAHGSAATDACGPWTQGSRGQTGHACDLSLTMYAIVCTTPLQCAPCCRHDEEGLRAPSLWRHRTAPELPLSHSEPTMIHTHTTSLCRPGRRGASPGCWSGLLQRRLLSLSLSHACASPRWLSFCAWQALPAPRAALARLVGFRVLGASVLWWLSRRRSGGPVVVWSVLGAKALEILQKYPACNNGLLHALYVT